MDYSTQVGGKMIIIIKSYTTAQPVVIVIRARGNTLNTRAGKKKKKRKRKKKQADCKTGEKKKEIETACVRQLPLGRRMDRNFAYHYTIAGASDEEKKWMMTMDYTALSLSLSVHLPSLITPENRRRKTFRIVFFYSFFFLHDLISSSLRRNIVSVVRAARQLLFLILSPSSCCG